MTFKPKLSETTHHIANNYRKKLAEDNEAE